MNVLKFVTSCALSSAALTAQAVAGPISTAQSTDPVIQWNRSLLAIVRTPGAQPATDHNGQHFELSSLRGRVVLIFFGYTFCPDACPTTLSKLAAVTARLGRDGDRLKTLYVSVDPERDTPDVLKADLANFRLDALGLTGTKAEIDKVTALYRAA